jgi:hypothetical protein
MKTPIFVYEPATLHVFSTKEKAEAYIEAIDVTNGAFTAAYDSEGFRLEIEVTPDNDVIFNSADPPENRAEELRVLLQVFLKGAKGVSDDWLASTSLNELIVKSLDYKTR